MTHPLRPVMRRNVGRELLSGLVAVILLLLLLWGIDALAGHHAANVHNDDPALHANQRGIDAACVADGYANHMADCPYGR